MSNIVNVLNIPTPVKAGLHAIDKFETMTGTDPESAFEKGYRHEKLTKAKIQAMWLYCCLKTSLTFDQFWDALDEDVELAANINKAIAADEGEKKSLP